MRLVDSIKDQSGLYTIREAALYAKMPVSTLRYWTQGDRKHPPLRKPRVDREEGRFLTFLEFQEAVVVRYFREVHNAPLLKIREAIIRAREEYEVEYPFASRFHKTSLVGKDFHILLRDEKNPIQITGRDGRQRSFREVIEPYMKNFRFDDADMPISYIAYRYPIKETGELIHINMNPSYCFGEPVVGSTGYRAQTLWRAAQVEGSEERAAECYDIDYDSVVAACKYCEEEIRIAA